MKTYATALIALGATFASAQTFNGGGFTFQDATGTTPGIASGDLAVTGTGTSVSSINNVILTGFSHSYVGDIEVELTHLGSNTSVTLFSPRDNESANLNGNYVLVVDPSLPTIDEATSPLGTGDDLASGSYAIATYGGGINLGSRTSYLPFSGLSLDSTWRLTVTDYATGDTGAVSSWSFDATPVPEPATLAVLGLGALLLRRRRA